MNLILLGINYKTAPIELREKVAISREDLAAAARSLVSTAGVTEALILSTCNRVEILTAATRRTWISPTFCIVTSPLILRSFVRISMNTETMRRFGISSA